MIADILGVMGDIPPPPLWAGAAVAGGIAGTVVAGRAAVRLGRRLRRAAARRKWAMAQRELNQLRAMTWQEFEAFAAALFGGMGWGVQETGGGGADDGADLVLMKNGRRIIVQCKRYKDRVGVPVVREAVGTMMHFGARGVYIVALSGFTKTAEEFAVGKPIKLVDGEKLLTWAEAIREKEGM
jgi:restriction system protein